ncbi:MAG: glycoside hydrolase family 38 C-terminal domain-containing protein, partial [Anditalea sp.]
MKSNANPVNKTKQVFLIIVFFMLLTTQSFSQKAYFIDGYHGGVYGHYPDWNTRFMVEMLAKNPDWKINLEIEPETWDTVMVKDPAAYSDFKALFADQSLTGRIDYVNPSYGQSFLYNTSGESIIRQFSYGMKKVREHFPSAVFTNYSSEEPCFTSALPQILKSFGYKYASLKNPNTCWGGYTRAFGGELVNWVGPDGTKLLTVPRYEIEALKPKSTWETIANRNSLDYVQAAFSYGIAHPVGMTLQDAGWRQGPWLGDGKGSYQPTEYKTWRDYIENISVKTPEQDWRFSQEDVLVSLVWGSQVLQRLAQRIRVSENMVVTAEKLAAMAVAYRGVSWPKSSFDDAWRNLLLAQHHDCWIVPYNGRPGNTWADKVATWTGVTNQKSDSVMRQSMIKLAAVGGQSGGSKYIRVFNTLGTRRSEFVTVTLPSGWDTGKARVLDSNKEEVPSQVISTLAEVSKKILFRADVPSIGYNTYQLQRQKPSGMKGASVSVLADGTYKVETDLYSIILDPSKGGTVTSLVAKALGNREFVDQLADRRFNELRGNFYRDGGFHSSTQNAAKIRIVEEGPVQIRLEIKGTIAGHPFAQEFTVSQGERRIDLSVRIDWEGNPGIGNEYAQSVPWQNEDNRKAFYNDQDKLLALFPLNLKSQKVYKDAPYDVTESRLGDTFFTTWDSIKNNVVLNWVDVTDGLNSYGMALLTDHTTSYAHGVDHPLGLTLQYSGIGLWGRNYRITGPTEVTYALIPHKGKWDNSGIWTEGTRWNEPLVAMLTDAAPLANGTSRSMVSVSGVGLEVGTLLFDGPDLLVRLFNVEGEDDTQKISFDGKSDRVDLVELNGDLVESLRVENDGTARTAVTVSVPRFGIRTLRLSNFKA